MRGGAQGGDARVAAHKANRDALHAGIGSDLDGAFGTEQGPADVDTIADLQKLPALLAARGYSADDVENVCSGNFLRFLRKAWS